MNSVSPHLARLVRVAVPLAALLLQGCSSDDPPPLTAPAAITYSAPVAVYGANVPAAPNSPTVTGGAPTGWTSSTPLPAGLTLDSGTGVISGTPTAVTANATYAITGMNAVGAAMTTSPSQLGMRTRMRRWPAGSSGTTRSGAVGNTAAAGVAVDAPAAAAVTGSDPRHAVAHLLDEA